VHLGGPAALAYDAGVLWCAIYPGPGLVGSLVKVDTATGRRLGSPVPLPPAGRQYLLAVGPDGVWLAAGKRLWRIDPDTAAVASATQLPGAATALEDSDGSVWATVVAAGGGRLVRVDPASGIPGPQAPVGPSPSALTVAAGSAWVTDSADQSILRFSLAKGRVRRSGEVSLPRSTVRAPTQITVYNGFVWVYERGRVLRIDPSTDNVLGTTTVASVADGTIAAGSGGIWIITRTRARRGAVRLLDGSTGLAAGRRIVIGGRPTAIVTDGHAAWVFDSAADRLLRVAP
jgi:sugar lactone lactonase YvrE